MEQATGAEPKVDPNAELMERLKGLEEKLAAAEKGKMEMEGTLGKYRSAMRPQNAGDQQTLFDNIAFAMGDAGFSHEEISNYISQTRKAQQGENKPKEGEGESSIEDLLKELGLDGESTSGGDDVNKELLERLARMEKRMEDGEKSRKTERWTLARKKMERQVKDLVANDPGIQKLVQGRLDLQDWPSEDEKNKTRKILEDAIQKDLWGSTVEGLKEKADLSGGKWEEEWIDEATTKASSQVQEKFRAVIADPAKLRRSPETVTGLEGLEGLKDKTPIEAPQFKPELTTTEMEEQATKHAVDSLMRGMLDAEQGNESKV